MKKSKREPISFRAAKVVNNGAHSSTAGGECARTVRSVGRGGCYNSREINTCPVPTPYHRRTRVASCSDFGAKSEDEAAMV